MKRNKDEFYAFQIFLFVSFFIIGFITGYLIHGEKTIVKIEYVVPEDVKMLNQENIRVIEEYNFN